MGRAERRWKEGSVEGTDGDAGNGRDGKEEGVKYRETVICVSVGDGPGGSAQRYMLGVTNCPRCGC